MDIEVRRLGSPNRPMLGLYQRPTQGRPLRGAFLMCRPFGQEAIRTAPIYRAMSDRLAREGCAVLTFDFHGCGDSPGESEEQSMADWIDDAIVAHRHLHQIATKLPIHWFAMGLAANTVSAAAVRAEPAVKCVVLWEPILNGPNYLQDMIRAHRQELEVEMGRTWRELVEQGGELEPTLPGSVLGFEIGTRLHNDLMRLGGLPLSEISARNTRIVVALQKEHRAALTVPSNAEVTLQTVQTATNWMSIEAGNSAIVPQEIPRTLLATL